jgi:hypothetical protein
VAHKRSATTALLVAFVQCAVSVSNASQRPLLNAEDSRAWEQKVWVTGHVHLTDHPSLGRTPANGAVIAFRRTDGSNHITGVRADINGRYELFLDPGPYRIIVADVEDHTRLVDSLARGQVRTLEVRKNSLDIRFDVELVVGKR